MAKGFVLGDWEEHRGGSGQPHILSEREGERRGDKGDKPQMDDNFYIPGVGDITAEVMEELRKGTLVGAVEQRAVELQAEQIARERPRQGATDFSFGRLVAEIPIEAFQAWEAKEGVGVFAKDKRFLREFLRDNPACRVESRSRKTMVGYR